MCLVTPVIQAAVDDIQHRFNRKQAKERVFSQLIACEYQSCNITFKDDFEDFEEDGSEEEECAYQYNSTIIRVEQKLRNMF